MRIFSALKILLLPYLSLMLLFSCATHRAVQGVPSGESHSSPASFQRAYKERVVASSLRLPALRASLGNIRFSGKGLPLGGGELRMKRGAVIQILVTMPLVGEVGRIAFTPQEVLVVNRMEREYVRAHYEDVPFLSRAGLDYSALEALFWNELFVPGEKDVRKSLDLFSFSQSGDHTLLTLSSAPLLEYSFLTRTADALPLRLTVSSKDRSDPVTFQWKNDRFQSFKGKLFPGEMAFGIEGLKKPFSLSFTLSGLRADDSWPTETKVPAKYKLRDIELLLSRLSALSGM